MKHISLLLVAIGFCIQTSQLHAQVLEDVVTGLNNPYGLLIIGNDLYFTEYNGDRISNIDAVHTSEERFPRHIKG